LGLGVEISCRVYRPRKPRESPLYQLVERHLEQLLAGARLQAALLEASRLLGPRGRENRAREQAAVGASRRSGS